MDKKEFVYEEVSYILRGIFFQVHNELGRYRNEKQFCDAIAVKLTEVGFPFLREAVIEVSFDGERKGRCRVDFIVDGKVILEIKTVSFLTQTDYDQCKRYLVSTGFKLCLLVNFRSDRCVVKRVLNPHLVE